MTGLGFFSLLIKVILLPGPIDKDCQYDSDAAVPPYPCHLVVIKKKHKLNHNMCGTVCVLIKRMWNYEDNESWP